MSGTTLNEFLAESVSIYVFSTTDAHFVNTYDVLRRVTVIKAVRLPAYVWMLLILFEVFSFQLTVYLSFSLFLDNTQHQLAVFFLNI